MSKREDQGQRVREDEEQREDPVYGAAKPEAQAPMRVYGKKNSPEKKKKKEGWKRKRKRQKKKNF